MNIDNFLDEKLYVQCLEYVKLYLVLDDLNEYDELDEIINDFYGRLKFLLDDLNVSLSRIRNENYDIVTDMDNNIERFNYHYTFSDYAEVKDITDDGFRVRVFNEDVEDLDSVLNSLHNHVEDLIGANHNLNRIINSYNQLLDRKSDEYCDDVVVSGVLDSLKRELL